jgi:hypothetical protein
MIRTNVILPTVAAILLAVTVIRPTLQKAIAQRMDDVPKYAGVYRWQGGSFLYLQMWSELSGKDQLVTFDESGQVRTLYPDGGQF